MNVHITSHGILHRDRNPDELLALVARGRQGRIIPKNCRIPCKWHELEVAVACAFTNPAVKQVEYGPLEGQAHTFLSNLNY